MPKSDVSGCCEVQQVSVSEAMLTEVRQNVLTALNVSKDGRIELAEFARSVPTDVCSSHRTAARKRLDITASFAT